MNWFLLCLIIAGVRSYTARYHISLIFNKELDLNRYLITVFVNNGKVAEFDSDDGKFIPTVEFMNGMNDSYWKENQEQAVKNHELAKLNVETLMSRYNQTEGTHVYQVRYGCSIGDMFLQTYGYDGENFMYLDTNDEKYVAEANESNVTVKRYNSAEVEKGKDDMTYFRETCLPFLDKFTELGKVYLARKTRPVIKIGELSQGDFSVLRCSVYGFFPKGIDIYWMDTSTETMLQSHRTDMSLPNPDGTYSAVVETTVNPNKEITYYCFVRHSSIDEEVIVLWQSATFPLFRKKFALYLAGAFAPLLACVLLYVATRTKLLADRPTEIVSPI